MTIGNYLGAGIILVSPDRTRYLVLRGHTGVWSFSKGHPEIIDSGTPLRTACRETFEETGFVAGVDYTVLGNSIRFGKRPYWVGVMDQETMPRLAEREHSGAAWLTVDEIEGVNGNGDIRDWVKKMDGEFMRLASYPL